MGPTSINMEKNAECLNSIVLGSQQPPENIQTNTKREV